MAKVGKLFKKNCGEDRDDWKQECHVKEFFPFMLEMALRRNPDDLLMQWAGFTMEDWEKEEVLSDMLKCHIADSSLLAFLE